MLNPLAPPAGILILGVDILHPPLPIYKYKPEIFLPLLSIEKFLDSCQFSRKLEVISKYRIILVKNRIYKHWCLNVRAGLCIHIGHWKKAATIVNLVNLMHVAKLSTHVSSKMRILCHVLRKRIQEGDHSWAEEQRKNRTRIAKYA